MIPRAIVRSRGQGINALEARNVLIARSLLLSTVNVVSVPCPAAVSDSGWNLPGWPPAAAGACPGAEAGAAAAAAGAGADAAAAAGAELSLREHPASADPERSWAGSPLPGGAGLPCWLDITPLRRCRL